MREQGGRINFMWDVALFIIRYHPIKYRNEGKEVKDSIVCHISGNDEGMRDSYEILIC